MQFPRIALGAVLGGLTLLVAASAGAQDARALPSICQRGAVADPVGFEHVLYLEMLDYFATHAERVDYEAFAPEDQSDHEAYYKATTLAQAIEWPGVLADRAAELPASAHDLPWLTLLAYSQTDQMDPIWALTRGPESILSPDLLPLMERNGLTVEAGLLRKAIALFPEWGLNPTDRANLVVEYDGGKVNEPLNAALETLEAHWPLQPNGPAEAALRLIRAEPALLAGFEARLAALDEVERLNIQVGRLWTRCMGDWWGPEEADASLSALGSAQAGLLLLDMLSFTVDGTSLHPWFEDNGASQTPALARLLERRGETELAAALREGMALFPQPFARDSETRWTQLELMDEATIYRLDRLMPADGYDRIRAVMLGLAKDSGLLPG